MGESMQRINKSMEALPHQAPLSNYKVQAFIAEYAFRHRKDRADKPDQPDEYDSLPMSGNTVMKWWIDKAHHDKYRAYVDHTPGAMVNPHSAEDVGDVVKKILTYDGGPASETIH